MSIVCYRADHRAVDVGSVMVSPGDHISRLQQGILAAEERLRAASSAIMQMRSTGLFVFTDREWVLRYGTLTRRFVYELSVEEGDVLHAADMMLVNEVGDATNETDISRLVAQYIAGERRDSRRVEYIIKQACVVSCLATPLDANKNRKQIYGRPGGSGE